VFAHVVTIAGDLRATCEIQLFDDRVDRRARNRALVSCEQSYARSNTSERSDVTWASARTLLNHSQPMAATTSPASDSARLRRDASAAATPRREPVLDASAATPLIAIPSDV
jgi:hypothetical protein